ncbi:hypothetical protein [Bdellovibrio svalbardensis]|uniref:Uncharacterized protein n=1 Tax=Bdellovibrio svalbardensis TaxID=2972972 RepID=A0ABT6DP19_9BACT|nr:hypothetical protein [Bdellovibrio svalbardensis]MDG0818237.1 hypothetical protein [Bdellovibrio svalbardensis]
MRLLLFVLTFVSSTLAVAVQPVSGTIERKGQDILLQSNDACSYYRIETKNSDAQAALEKLSPGDSLTASGLIDKVACVAVVESVDYVGLKRMLGTWLSKEGLIAVHDFNTLFFYPQTKTDFKRVFEKPADFTIGKSIRYKYSVTPSEGKEWVMFLSDAKSTTFATIQFSKEVAIMKLYDSDSGAVTKTLILTRNRSL